MQRRRRHDEQSRCFCAACASAIHRSPHLHGNQTLPPHAPWKDLTAGHFPTGISDPQCLHLVASSLTICSHFGHFFFIRMICAIDNSLDLSPGLLNLTAASRHAHIAKRPSSIGDQSLRLVSISGMEVSRLRAVFLINQGKMTCSPFKKIVSILPSKQQFSNPPLSNNYKNHQNLI